MKKTIFNIFILVSLSLVLSGCGLKNQYQNKESAPQQTSIITNQSLQQEENNINLDEEMTNLDITIDSAKETDFSQDELSDSNLGI